MTTQRPAAHSKRSVGSDLPAPTAEEIRSLKEAETRRREPRYSLDLVATLTVSLLGPQVPDETERMRYAETARRAIMLLDVCQEELLRDADASVIKAMLMRQNDVAGDERQHLQSLCQGGVVPFGEGLRWITGQRSLTQAKPLFKLRWKYLHEHPDASRLVQRRIGQDPETVAICELERSRRDGFDPDKIVAMRTGFDAWYEAVKVPSERASAGRKGGRMFQRRKSRA